MYNPHEVPLPYHTRVKNYTEQGDVTIEVLNELGQWMEKVVDRYEFDTLTGGSTVCFVEKDFEEPLLICPDGRHDTPLCAGCPCLQAHYSWECGRSLNDEVCPDCEPVADYQQEMCDEWFEESHPIVIEDSMPGIGYGDISPRTLAYATREMWKRAQPYLLFEKFGQNLKNNFPGSGNTSKTIKFRRYGSGIGAKQEKFTHMADAISYQMQGDWYNEAAKITTETWEATGKNPHS